MLAIAHPVTVRPLLRVEDRSRAFRLVIELHGILMRIAERSGFPGALIPPLQSAADAAAIVASIEPTMTPGDRRARYRRALARLGEATFNIDMLHESELLGTTDCHHIDPQLTLTLRALDALA